uniref:Uncharacterized protein n=1 Tax=Lepeophtheirus salmonis TaxID=72036 RepID=A0A0K2TVF2_LEPSM
MPKTLAKGRLELQKWSSKYNTFLIYEPKKCGPSSSDLNPYYYFW